MKRILLSAFMVLLSLAMSAQRFTDQLDRGLVAVKVSNGVFCSWRITANEYYDVTYNLYRDGSLIAGGLTTSNYTDPQGSTASVYTVSAVVRGIEQPQSGATAMLTNNWLEVKMNHGNLKSTYVPNDATFADVDGDGELELIIKFDNSSWAGAGYPKEGYQGEYFLMECYKLNGTRLWYINLGPNMADFQNNEQNIAAYDWDMDGKAECLIRAADGTKIYTNEGVEQVIGDATKNYMVNVGGGQWFVHEGAEYLVYFNGQTGQTYQVMEYPLKRLEANENNLEAAWGDGYGHRSSKHFFGAPFLDGRKPSIFLARGIYTRHKMIAYEVNPSTHELMESWRWNCNDSSSPYFGQGYHNYTIADVDWDGRDEIVFGSMVIDDNGKGLSTTGLGHGDAHHVSNFDPYSWGQQIYACNEDRPSNNYRDATTSKIRYRHVGSDDDGRAMAGNFCNDYPGAMGLSAHDEAISCVTNGYISGLTKNNVSQNMRIYWDGDLCEESFNYVNGKNTAGGIYKYGSGLIATLAGSMTNNDTKGTPCFQGDVFGDWREEVVMRTSANNVRIYTTTNATPWRNYSLWYDHQYRNAMVTQMCGYNQPPHVSYFLGELEGITQAPPAITMASRSEISNGGTITTADEILITCETNDMEVNVAPACEPYIYIDNAPSWVQGTNSTSTTNPVIIRSYYTHTLKGGTFAGGTRIVKQGDGILVLPSGTHTHTGNTDVWAGTLQCDGTLQNSRLWLNRHTSLITNGGHFMNGIQADYNATIYPGGQESVGTVTTSTLSLGFGSRIVFDVVGSNSDMFQADKLVIEKKVWPNGGGPAYSTPVFQFSGSVAPGTYQIATVAEVEGNISDIVVEGLSNMKVILSYEEGKILLEVREYTAQDLFWAGTVNGIWNTDETANFTTVGGEQAVFVPQSNVTFDDSASKTSVTISGIVAPESIVFNNNSKTYIINGDSIAGSPSLTKNGSGQTILNNVNHLGNTIINDGTLTVASLANTSGTDYGSLGSISSTITINGGATFGVNTTATSDQPMRLGSGGGAISVSSGKTLTQSAALSGSGQTLTKKGAGTLSLPAALSLKRLVISQGTVTASEANSITSLPETVEFQGGTLKDPVNIYSYTTNNANFEVPEGKTGTFYGDARCNYKGKLTGAGTFNVYATSVRGYFQGDWSAFEGTVTANTFKSDSYDPAFIFDNSYGLPKAMLRISSGVTFDNNGRSMSIGSVSGTGQLGGSGTYTIGTNNSNITVTFGSQSPIVKEGTGTMIATSPGLLTKTVTLNNGKLVFDATNGTNIFGGALTANTGTEVIGEGAIGAMTLNDGAQVSPRSTLLEDAFGVDVMPGVIKASASVNFKQGSVLNIYIDGADSYSSIQPRFLTMNGTVKVVFLDGYQPSVGDEFVVWEAAQTFSGTPTVELPELPQGLEWDTSDLKAKHGVLRIKEAETEGVSLTTSVEATCQVFTPSGVCVATMNAARDSIREKVQQAGLPQGTYIVVINTGNRTETTKVVVR